MTAPAWNQARETDLWVMRANENLQAFNFCLKSQTIVKEFVKAVIPLKKKDW